MTLPPTVPAEASELGVDARLNDLVDMLMRMSQLDFAARATVGERGDLLDALAAGLNILSEELAVHMAQRAAMEQELRNSRDEFELRVKLRTAELVAMNEDLTHEIAERKRVEIELGLTHKLEAIGELASGIAHEINTPTQYVTDNVRFLQTSFADLEQLRKRSQEACTRLARDDEDRALLGTLGELAETIELPYLEKEVPKAFESTLEGLAQIAKIVGAVKEFGRPDNGEKLALDVNRALLTTLDVARNEYKYDADVVTELGELPPVICLCGEIRQVFLNLVVNAAHAIRAASTPERPRGIIRIHSEVMGSDAVVTISDTGCGIPPEIRHRIFDPFFTTKPVGHGTGQGLTIARSIVVDKHGGSLTFESETGTGTIFTLRIPLQPPA